MSTPRLLRALGVVAVLLTALAPGGSASARSLMSGPLVEHWDGTSWSQVAVPSIQYGLDAVVAPSAKDVWAFGVSQVALHWDGTSWERVTLPVPKDSAAPGFYGAAAVSPDDVWAVGDVSPAHAPSHAIIDHWNGRRWMIVSGPPARSELYGITAISANDVWAVGAVSVSTPGGFERLALTLHWNGTKWKQVATPNPATSATPAPSVANYLFSVAGSSSRNVWAVGRYWRQANGVRGSRALVLHWNGSGWKLVPSPDFVASHVSFLNGVTAPSATGVWAVGGANRKGSQQALAERWNGSRWNVVHTTGSHLVGVSALAANDAWAVGTPYANGRVLRWNGKAWSAATKLGASHGLAAVAEVSPTDVWAVGGSVRH